jgi:hypothetical protein
MDFEPSDPAVIHMNAVWRQAMEDTVSVEKFVKGMKMKPACLKLDAAVPSGKVHVTACSCNLGDTAVRVFINGQLKAAEIQSALERVSEMVGFLHHIGKAEL